MRQHSVLAIFAIAAGAAVAAAGSSHVRGRVVDEFGDGLPGTSVYLLSLPDSVSRGMTMTDDDGRYTFETDSTGRYMLLMTMTGMQPAALDVIVPGGEAADSIDVEDVMLTENAAMLQEVVVKGVKTAVIAREDTLEYNAGSFHTRTNATVEDLLKKLPGVEVGSDGSITSGGKTVTKILVDGKEFFGDDPSAATKNLPSDMVDKVQVINQKSDLARLTGVDDGEEETVINLSVKKNMRNGWFGNAEAGYGTDGRYKYSFNVNRFHNGNQITLLGGGNNINEMGFADRGRGRFGSFGGSDGINSSQHIGLNFNVGDKERLRVGGNVIYSHSDRKTISSTETQYLFPDSVSWLSSGTDARDRGHNVNADFRLQWKIDEANTIDFRPHFVFSHRDMEKTDSATLRAGDVDLSRVYRNDSERRIRGNSYDISGNLIFNHNFLSHPGRSISAQLRYSFSDARKYEYSWNKIKYYLINDDDEELFRYLNTRQWSSTLNGRLTWTEPLGDASRGNYLTIAYSADYRWNNADRMTYSLDPLLFPGSLDVPDGNVPSGAAFEDNLSNRFRNRFFTQELQLGYKRVARNFNLETGLVFSPASSSSTDLINDARNIPTRWVYNVAPFLRMKLKFSDNSTLRLHYRARTSQPSMSQLQPVADTSDPLNITVGNPSLKPSFTQSVMAHFNDFNTDSQRSIFGVINASYTSNGIAVNSVTNPETGVRTTTYDNVNGNWQLMAMGMLTQPLRNRNWRINARLNTRYVSSAGFVDGDRNRSGNFSIAPSAGVTFSSDIFQFTLGPSYSFQLATATLQSQPNRKVHSYGFDADASLYLPFGLELTTDLSMAHNTGYTAGYNTNQWLWNAQLSYSLLRDKSLTLSLSVYDILQEKKNISRSVSSSAIIDSRVNDLTRYAMLSVTWKFNSFGSRKDIPKVDGDDRPEPPMGGEPPKGGGGGRPPMEPPPGGM